MKFLIESAQKSCGRLGILQKNDVLKYETPMLLLYTKAASIPYLSHEVFEYLNKDQSTSIALEIPLDTIYHMQKALNIHKKGLLSYSGFSKTDSILTFATLKNPAELCPSGFHDKGHVSIFSKAGRKQITPDGYMDLVEACCPDIFHPLCDGDTGPNSSKKRLVKSVDRTESFLTKCLERYRQSERLNNSMFVVSLEGGYSIPARQAMIKNLNHSEIDGYVLDGFHTNGPSVTLINSKDLQEIIDKSIEQLPDDKPKFMLGAYNPLTVLELIQMGIDIFDSCYAYLMTTENCAMTFNFDTAKMVKNDFDIDFTHDKYKDDLEPILKGCTCLTCQKHSRAYIHHLVNTKELLSMILLMIHNTHHYIEFFKMIRTSIANGQLSVLIELVRSQQLNEGSTFQLKIGKQQQKQEDNTKCGENNERVKQTATLDN